MLDARSDLPGFAPLDQIGLVVLDLSAVMGVARTLTLLLGIAAIMR
jgi:hypothetical protein